MKPNSPIKPRAAGLIAVLCLTAAFAHAAPGDKADDEIELDARRAYGYLVKICRIGRRVSGSRGMARQQQMLVEHFSDLGADVRFQSFDAAHPRTGRPVRMSNLVVSWHPETDKRVLLACHYDTRPYPDRDPRNPRGLFLGANDGASGVALFMELGHHMEKLSPEYGVDFVFFDGEELVYGDRGEYFLGSKHFARQYKNEPPDHRYVCGVLVDMVADRNLSLFMEKNSLEYAPRVTRSVWETARELGVGEFVPREKHKVRDDHIPLNEIAEIPTCNVIDFDYRHWHTTRDVPSNCSGASLAKVGKVLAHWLTDVPEPGEP